MNAAHVGDLLQSLGILFVAISSLLLSHQVSVLRRRVQVLELKESHPSDRLRLAHSVDRLTSTLSKDMALRERAARDARSAGRRNSKGVQR